MKECKTGIVFVHGIQGGPQQFDFLTERLPASVAYRNVLLPGHGATVKEFRRSGANEWLAAVTQASADMRDKCEELYFVGHSMGCLLGLLTEDELNCFSRMIMICAPFYVRLTARYFKINFSAALKKQTNDPFVLATRKANSVSAKHAASYLFCAHPYLELFKLIKQVRRSDPKTACAEYYFSELDEIVGRKSASYAAEHLGAKTQIFAGCGHNCFTDTAKEQLTSKILEMTGN
ncbi:MAG: alpha/beta hydrolase [Clostridia bacterium]|nr:alpha/beta hydrolase [Clostridia bacterium]